MKTKPSELKQNLFKAGIGLAAFGFAAAGHELTAPLTALVSLAGNVASQFGVEACMPYITKKWLSHPDKVVNHHIERALVEAIHSALTEIEQEYLVRDDVSSHERQSLQDFFAVLRSRSEQEFMEAARDELTKPEILDYVYDRAGASAHLQDRLRIQIDPLADDYYFTQRFLDYFPDRFAGLVQSHFKELLKKGDEAKQAMDLLFFETLRAGLNELKISQADLKTSLNTALETGIRTAQQLDFYGELWISAIRQNRAQLDRVEQNTETILKDLGLVGTSVEQVRDLLQKVLSQSVQPGLLVSVQFLQLTQTVRDSERAFAEAQTKLAEKETSLAKRETSLTKQETAIVKDTELIETLTESRNDARQIRNDAQTAATQTDSNRQQARQSLNQFLAEVANTQKAIADATSHRADVARQLFEQGQFAEANAALDADELRRDKTDLLQQRDALRQQLTQLARDFILKANMLLLAKEPDWFTQARRLFEEAVETDESYDTCFALGHFLQEHNQHLDAMVLYKKALLLSADEPQKALLLNNLANLYKATSRFEQAEAAYNEGLRIRRALAEVNPATYLPDVAMTLNNLAILYQATNRFEQAETAFDKEALTICRQLAQQNPLAYLPYVAMTLNNLANLYWANQRFVEAEADYGDALTIYRQLAWQNPNAYNLDAGGTAANISIFYLEQPTPNQEQSVDYALLALFYAIPYQDRVPLAQQIAGRAIKICGHWGVDWQAELQKRFGEGES